MAMPSKSSTDDLSPSTAVSRALKAVTGAGFVFENLAADADLELYMDISDGGIAIGYISRGWNDPGFRIADQVAVPDLVVGSDYSDALREFCATNGVAVSWSIEEGQVA